MNERIRGICNKLRRVIKLSKDTDYEQFPLDYLTEITDYADSLINPPEDLLVKNLTNIKKPPVNN